MTDRELQHLAKQLRAGAAGYRCLGRAMRQSMVGDATAINRINDRVEALQRELDDLAGLVESAPAWLRAVRNPGGRAA